MSKVRYRTKDGNVYVYESTPHTDPVTGKPKPIRKYLGYEDKDGVFHESSGKRGRRGNPSPDAKTVEVNIDYKQRYEEAIRKLEDSQKRQESYVREIAEFQETVRVLKKKLKSYEKMAKAMYDLAADQSDM